MIKGYLNKLKFLVILVLLLSCSKEQKNNVDFIKNLSNDTDFNLPLYNESLKILIDKDDVIYVTSLRQLYNLKESKHFNYKDFDSFLIEVINNDLLSKDDLVKISETNFKIDKEIQEKYHKEGLNYLLKEYTEKTKMPNKYYIISDLNVNTKLCLMYLFFRNNYYVMQNDYSGKYVLIDKNI
ncbi:hypothetical protein ACHRVW_11615 [Flavobacterium collinsii]|uniref:hypothetical protein n=1 Tax=Flavobacterium collinsii TaxID=1114861 RepID=UPI003757E5F4